MSDVNEMGLHLVVIFGEVFPEFAIAPQHVAEALGENAVIISCSWQEQRGHGTDFWDLIGDEREARSLGREIAVSSGWRDEPVVPVLLSRPEGQEELTAARLAQAVTMVAEQSRCWGMPVAVHIHSITIGAPGPHQAGLLADLAAQTGGSLGGEIDSTKSQGLQIAIQSNLWIGRMAVIVSELLQEEGFLPHHSRVVGEAVVRIADRFRSKGLTFAMDEARLTRNFARKMMASILREEYWEI